MDQAILEQAKAELSKCKTQFLKNPTGRGIAAAVFALEWEFEDCGTAYTNGVKVVIDPGFFMSLSDGAMGGRVWLIAHEVWHVLLKHQVRAQSYEQEDWHLLNIAADHVINTKLEDDGYQVPHTHEYNGKKMKFCVDRKYKDWSTEKVFEDLKQNDPNQKSQMPDIQSGNGASDTGQQGSGGQHGQGQGQGQGKKMSADELQKMENQMNNVITKTHHANKQSGHQAGFGMGEMDRILDEILNPKIPWQTLLFKFMTERFKDDYSWRMPNMNFMPDFYIPSCDSEGMGNLGLFVDASGSVSDEDFAEFKGQMSHIISILKPRKTIVAEFDTKLRTPVELPEGQGLANVKFTGYGGTAIHQTMDYIHKTSMEVAVIFTDGYFSEYVPPRFTKNIIWVIKGRYDKNFDYPVGEVIYMDD